MRKVSINAALLASLITKAGLAKDPVFEEVFKADATEDLALPDAAAQKLHDNVTSIEGAKAIPELENHFKGVHFGKTDAKVISILKVKGYTEDEIKKLVEGKSAEDKIEIAIEAVEKKAAKGTPSERETQLSTAYDQLKNTHATELQKWEDKYKTLESQFTETRENSAFQSALSAFKLRDDLDPSLVQEMAIRQIRRAAEEKGALLTLSADGRSFELKSKADPTKDAYDPGAPTSRLEFSSLATGALDTAKLINKIGREQPSGEPARRNPHFSGDVPDRANTPDRQSSSAMAAITAGTSKSVVNVGG